VAGTSGHWRRRHQRFWLLPSTLTEKFKLLLDVDALGLQGSY
jgi:hypothetical protein